VPLTIVHAGPRYRPAPLVAPAPYGYIYLAAEVAPPAGPPFPPPSPRRDALLRELKAHAADLVRAGGVVRAAVHRGALLPPPSAGLVPPDPERVRAAGASRPVATAAPLPSDLSQAPWARAAMRPLRADVALLVVTATPDDIPAVQAGDSYRRIVGAVAAAARNHRIVTARCGKRIADVQPAPRGLYLFNHFVAEEPAAALELWEHLAGWYVAETGLRNSEVMIPLERGEYALVNYARWDYGLPTLARRQFAKPSFRTFVLANLRANRTIALPALYRLA
jgi:hypothetical protein